MAASRRRVRRLCRREQDQLRAWARRTRRIGPRERATLYGVIDWTRHTDFICRTSIPVLAAWLEEPAAAVGMRLARLAELGLVERVPPSGWRLMAAPLEILAPPVRAAP